MSTIGDGGLRCANPPCEINWLLGARTRIRAIADSGCWPFNCRGLLRFCKMPAAVPPFDECGYAFCGLIGRCRQELYSIIAVPARKFIEPPIVARKTKVPFRARRIGHGRDNINSIRRSRWSNARSDRDQPVLVRRVVWRCNDFRNFSGVGPHQNPTPTLPLADFDQQQILVGKISD